MLPLSALPPSGAPAPDHACTMVYSTWRPNSPRPPIWIHFCPARSQALLEDTKGHEAFDPSPGRRPRPRDSEKNQQHHQYIWQKKKQPKPPPSQSRHFSSGRTYCEQTENGHTSTGPFPTSDLYNWKAQTPSFSRKTSGPH